MKVKSLTRKAMLFALCIVLNFLEGLFILSPIYPGVKLGLSNVVVMFALFSINPATAFSLALGKGVFAFITRGVSAGVLSLSGGVLSLLVILLLKKAFKEKSSLTTLSVAGGVMHNVAQLSATALMWKSTAVFSLSPLLIVSGVIFGMLNALLLKVTFPYLKRLGGQK